MIMFKGKCRELASLPRLGWSGEIAEFPGHCVVISLHKNVSLVKPPCMQYRERIRGERPVPGSPTGKLTEGLEEESDNEQLEGQPLLSL